MGPKAYAANKALDGGKELSWMDRMCLKMETFCELGEYGQGPTLIMQVCEFRGCCYSLCTVKLLAVLEIHVAALVLVALIVGPFQFGLALTSVNW
jgi:hypothetical protein